MFESYPSHIIEEMVARDFHTPKNWHTFIYTDQESHYHAISVVDIPLFNQVRHKKHWHIVASLENLTEEEKDGLYGCYTNDQRQDVITGIVHYLNRGTVFDPQRALNDLHRAVRDYLSKRKS